MLYDRARMGHIGAGLKEKEWCVYVCVLYGVTCQLCRNFVREMGLRIVRTDAA